MVQVRDNSESDDAGDAGSERVVAPRLDQASLSRAHVTLCMVESELRKAGRTEAADGLAYEERPAQGYWKVTVAGREALRLDDLARTAS
ncbi:MAG: hypothetical protein ACYDDA_09080 [Acidiferrobacteraceae bacterium]